MNFSTLYESVFAILRIDEAQGQGMVAGTAFVINQNPCYLLTCHHVVSEANENNDGAIKYSISKRTGDAEELDLNNSNITFLRINKIYSKAECDIAILEIDPDENSEVAEQLGITNAPPLKLNFEKNQREIGSILEWLSTGTNADMFLIPRFFKGNLVTKYKMTQGYSFRNIDGQDVQQTITDGCFLEVDQLFIPGTSGSPILRKDSDFVIGFVHGFRSWPVGTNAGAQYPVTIIENGEESNVQLKHNLPMVTSLSLAIDVRTVEDHLKENEFIAQE